MGVRPVCCVLDWHHQFGTAWLRCIRDAGYELVFLTEAPGGGAPPHGTDQPRRLLDGLDRNGGSPTVLLIAAGPAGDARIAILRSQAVHHLPAGWQPRTLEDILQDALPAEPRARLVGDSACMQRTVQALRRAGASDANVLLTGESGTGKELAAELVHASSRRAAGPFVCVNCAAIPDSLLESELFGHRKGAFTGADSPRDGKFSEAAGGTLFLDEIADLSHTAQAKVLRAIETKRIDRLGERGGLPVDVRIVTATNRDLEAMVASGLLRQDLYYRLNVVQIRMPALREHSEDIRALVGHFLRVLNHRFGLDLQGVSDAALKALELYGWPGNIRELRNLLEAVYVNPPLTPVISLAALPESFRCRLASAPQSGERERVLCALESVNWNKSRAARTLHWSRVTLYRKLARYQISAQCPPAAEKARHHQAAESGAAAP